MMRISRVGLCTFLVVAPLAGEATMPPPEGGEFPEAYLQRKQDVPDAFAVKRAFKPLVTKIQENRLAVRQGRMTMAEAQATGGIVVEGSREIPVLMGKFSNTGADPYPVSDLQTQLFDGPWPTQTMTEFYEEISYGRFSVGGTVFPWKTLSNTGAHYAGPGNCKGLCDQAKVADFLKELMDQNDRGDRLLAVRQRRPGRHAQLGRRRRVRRLRRVRARRCRRRVRAGPRAAAASGPIAGSTAAGPAATT